MKKLNLLLSILTIVLVAFLFGGCGKTECPECPTCPECPPAASQESCKEFYDEYSALKPKISGDKSMLLGTEQVLEADKEVAWSSLHPDIASVDESGKVKALKLGEAVIKAEADGQPAEFSIEVKEGFLIEGKSEMALTRSQSLVLRPFVDDDDANMKTMWVVDDDSIAEVDQEGKVTAKKDKGKVIVTAVTTVKRESQETKILTASFEIEVVPQKITITADKTEMDPGEKQKLTALVEPDGEGQKVTWKSNAEERVKVDEDGTVTALVAGKALITATTVTWIDVDPEKEYTDEEYEKLPRIVAKSEDFLLTVKGKPVPTSTDLYYHMVETEDPTHVNYWDSKAATVADLAVWVFGGFWDTRMNEEKDGYDWYPLLANGKPVPLEPLPKLHDDDQDISTKYKVEVKVGSELKYSTLSKVPKFAKYNNQEVKLDDYLTPWKHLYCQKDSLQRGPEELGGAGSIKGIEEFYKGTEEGFRQDLWDKVGVKAYEEGGKSYLEFEFLVPCNRFYAMYYLASNLYTPIPEDFIEEVGGFKNYAKFSADGEMSPVDTSLSTGFYTLEKWEAKKEILYKRNPNMTDGDRYAVGGIHVEILEAAKSDPEAVFKEFLIDKLDSAGIPKTQLDKYKKDPRTTKTEDTATSKFNINSCTQEMWIELFGSEGSVAQSNPDEYWECKPIMSNPDFLRGLSLSIDRKNLAEVLGRTPTCEYFAGAYMSNPEDGISYNTTDAHKEAIKSLTEGTDGMGYSLALAKEHFKRACETLIAEGKYKEGDEIEIEFAWQTQANILTFGEILKKYITDAFNDCGGGLKLKIKDYVCAVWTDVYFEKMMKGKFDLGLGSISGNPLNPINFLEVLRSDNISGFTLNYGVDTSKKSSDLVYDGQEWSFNALFEAADQGAFVKDGELAKYYNADFKSSKYNKEDGTRTLEFLVNTVNTDDGQVKAELSKVVICWYDSPKGYEEEELSFELGEGVVTATVPKEIEDKYIGNVGYDVYFLTEVCGLKNEPCKSFYSKNVENDEHLDDQGAKKDDAKAPVDKEGKGYSYVASSYPKRTEILGKLEKWAVEHFITGVTIYGDGGFVMYQDRLVPGSGSWDNYIPGYGFGVVSEGKITRPLGVAPAK